MIELCMMLIGGAATLLIVFALDKMFNLLNCFQLQKQPVAPFTRK